MKQKTNLTNLYIFPVVVFAVHLFATYIVDLYHIFPGFDVPMHFFGGMSIAYSTYYALKLLQQKKLVGHLLPIAVVVIMVSCAALAAVLWEFLEFGLDYIVYHSTHFQPSIIDTMKDLFMGIGGAYVIAALTLLKK
jgi:hypothetical protein